MDALTLFGSVLANMINKPILASKGILRFAIKDYHESVKHEKMEFEDWIIIFSDFLAPRLERFKISNSKDICIELKKVLEKNKSILVVGRV
ncbi:hypothetical protein NEF87_000638 [Candidatus Lokiarchaeum ossiferum]|uniref:Uncharacterized protein n=1 Tax=Candidatus Lokiarchaeum ossiferum TaxID=2951803 RepID=A0ABY6HLG6_9ARCH|nr:hypothetical protein NEF87_000638 [Candidatus Lokiarchaeum sp. B-35]